MGLISTQDRAELLLTSCSGTGPSASAAWQFWKPGFRDWLHAGRCSGDRQLRQLYGLIRQAALDEIYVDIPMDSGESFIPVLEEMESMGLTVHFRLLLLDRIEERCCGETSAVRFSRILGRCARATSSRWAPWS